MPRERRRVHRASLPASVSAPLIHAEEHGPLSFSPRTAPPRVDPDPPSFPPSDRTVSPRSLLPSFRAVAAAPARARDVSVLAADVAKVSFDGASAGSATLDLKVAKPDVAKGLVHKYVVMVRQNARRDGRLRSRRARFGVVGASRSSRRAPATRAWSSRTRLKPGGGVIFGPKPKDWSIKMNKKERRLAMATAIQSAAPAMIVVDDLSAKVSTPKTKEMAGALKAWGVAEGEKAYLIHQGCLGERHPQHPQHGQGRAVRHQAPQRVRRPERGQGRGRGVRAVVHQRLLRGERRRVGVKKDPINNYTSTRATTSDAAPGNTAAQN